MSGPFRFTQNSARSPLDRQSPNVYPAGQAPSFKTNVNRMKTKKWVEAKKNAYDGDDWGEYDEYDEYGTEQAAPPPQDMGLRRVGEPSRSFTDPTRQVPAQPARRNSFEAGDESRTFSSGYPPQGGFYGERQPHEIQTHGLPAAEEDQNPAVNRQASAAQSDTSQTPQHRRDFSPSALPPPLHTRMSQVPTNTTSSPVSQFPPRKSSVGQVDSPSATSPRERAPSNSGKALPFVRPADIYKRAEEERQRERASIDSSRPSFDSLTGRLEDDSQRPQPLETVAERKGEHFQNNKGPATQPPTVETSATSQAPIRRFSAFDNDFWSGDSQAHGTVGQPPVISSSDEQGFRSVVDQAFTRSDDQRSVPPTPISKQSDDGVSRSNTNSTTGISPIMSRVPSTATSALKTRNQGVGDGSTPVIAEETSESITPSSRPPSAAMLGGPYQVTRKPSPSHSRNVSSTSLPQAGLATPTRGHSPARSLAIESQHSTHEPESAYLSSTQSPQEDMEGGLSGPSAAYADREADIATAVKSSPEQTASGLGAASRESRDAFLESHQNASSPIRDALPRDRSESPSKGRVQELAGKFGDVSHSRRGSVQSNASRSSVQSWEKSQDNSRPSSPTKAIASGDRPTAEREASFRPKLPGQWESYATTVQTPLEQPSEPTGAFVDSRPAGENNAVSSPLGEVDLTPTTDKHPVSTADPTKSDGDPLAALKAAGHAIGDALQASVGATSGQSAENKEGQEQARAAGNTYLSRPVHPDRAISSAASSIPPTPPEKDTPESEDLPPPPPLKERSPEPGSSSQQQTPTRPTILPQLSTDPSDHDQESDRLRKEIVASLSPLRTSETVGSEPSQLSLQPGEPTPKNRESSILPSEYDSYWADDQASPRPSQDAAHGGLGQSSAEKPGPAEPSSSSNKPSLLTRFSWEDNNPGSVPSNEQAQPGAAQVSNEKHTVASKSPVTERAVDQSPEVVTAPSGLIVSSDSPSSHGAELNVRAPTPPADSAKEPTSPVSVDRELERGASPSSGLHVVNSAVNPEAVDLPPRLSADVSPISHPSLAGGSIDVSSISPPKSDSANPTMPTSPVGHQPTTSPTAKSPTSDKPLGFRDIVNLKSSSERILTYNKTRDYWASTDHGLGDWVSSAFNNNPELASQPLPQPQARPPRVTPSASFRHKPTGSLSLFSKHQSSGGATNQSTPYFEQYNSAASQTTGPASSAMPGAPGAGAGGPGARITSHQMQAKGKDLLHSAGVLGGKGMTGAKGLFAKGKSRFNKASGSGDKVDK